jgi:hypothetical protein
MSALLIDAVLAVHALFILYMIFGGLFALMNARLIWPHLAVFAWGIYIEIFAGICPLTILEQSLRRNAGQTVYSGGFIDHYLTAAIYPEGLTHQTQLWIGGALIVWSCAVYTSVLLRRRGSMRRAGQRDPLA